jgi:hypothetical protein
MHRLRWVEAAGGGGDLEDAVREDSFVGGKGFD